ncbi:hypothetical protein N0V88_000828 [Collariella sp. IMI 366227]|nr:hypothetical protein N0V88_000828 [Collariella sp. IMI 366227]
MPFYGDVEEGSDASLDQPSASKASGRGRKPPTYEEENPEEDDAATPDVKDDNGSDDDEELEEEVYVVERIMSHMIDKDPEENLTENATEVLNEYYASIGGRDKLFEETAAAIKSKKRGRPSSSTSRASGKRSRRNGDNSGDSEPPYSAKAVTWKPPPGSWEEHIAHLDACEDEDSGKLMMLRFYEQHVRIIKRDAESESAGTPV